MGIGLFLSPVCWISGEVSGGGDPVVGSSSGRFLGGSTFYGDYPTRSGPNRARFAQIRSFLKLSPAIDVLTASGSGDPGIWVQQACMAAETDGKDDWSNFLTGLRRKHENPAAKFVVVGSSSTSMQGDAAASSGGSGTAGTASWRRIWTWLEVGDVPQVRIRRIPLGSG